ncbi:MAG: 3-dehydroquinate synthase, partial [Clostridia bacterium]|nr:3-dehydroquinate synthase [Clostridia bacterium]
MKLSAGKYDIIIENGALAHAGEYALEALGKPGRALIVSDDNVFPLYGGTLTKSLADAGFDMAPEFVFPHGEASKTMT